MIDSSVLEKIQIFTVSIGDINYQPPKQSIIQWNNLNSSCNISRISSQNRLQSEKLINLEEEKIQQTAYQGIDRGLNFQTNTNISYLFNNQYPKIIPSQHYKNTVFLQPQFVYRQDFQHQPGTQSRNEYQNLQAGSSHLIEQYNQDQEQFILKRRNSRLNRLNEIKEKIKQKIKECKATCKLNQKQKQSMILNETEIKKDYKVTQHASKNKETTKQNLAKPTSQKNEQTGVAKQQSHQYNTRNHQKQLTLALKQKEELIKKKGTQNLNKSISSEENQEIKSPVLLKKIKQSPINPEYSVNYQFSLQNSNSRNSTQQTECYEQNNLISRFEKNQQPVIKYDNISLSQNKRKTRNSTAETVEKNKSVIQQFQAPISSLKKQICTLQTNLCKKSIKTSEKSCSNKQITQNNNNNNSQLSMQNNKKLQNQPQKQINYKKYTNEKVITQNNYKKKNKSLIQIAGNDLEEKRPQQKKNFLDKIDQSKDQEFDQIIEQKNKYSVQKKFSQNLNLKQAECESENQSPITDQIEIEGENFKNDQRDEIELETDNNLQSKQQSQSNENYDDGEFDDYLDELEELELQQYENEIDQEGSFLDYMSDDLNEKQNKNKKCLKEDSDCDDDDDEDDEDEDEDDDDDDDESSSSSDLSSYESFIENQSYENKQNIDENLIPTIYISSDESLIEVQKDQPEKIEKQQNNIQSEEIPKLEIILENDLINQMKDIVLSNQLNNLKDMILQSKCDLLNLKCYNYQMLSSFVDNVFITPQEFQVFKIQVNEDYIEYIMDNKMRCDFSDSCNYEPFSKIVKVFKGLYKKAIVNLASITHLHSIMKDLKAQEYSIKVQSSQVIIRLFKDQVQFIIQQYSDMRGKDMLEFMNSFQFKEIKKMDVAFLNDRIKYSKYIPINLYKCEIGCLSQFIRFKEAVERNAYFHKTVEINTQEQNQINNQNKVNNISIKIQRQSLNDDQWKYLIKYIRQKKDQNQFDGINFKIQYISTQIFKYLLNFIQKTENSFKNKYIIVSKDITIKYIDCQLIAESKRSDLLLTLSQKINIFQKMHKFCLLGLENNPFLDLSQTLKYFQEKIPSLPNLYYVHFEIPKNIDKKQGQQFGGIFSKLKNVRHLAIQIVDKEKDLINLSNYSINLCHVFKGIQQMQNLKYLSISMINQMNQYKYNSKSQKLSIKIIEQINLLLQKCTNITELYMNFPILNQNQLKQLITPISFLNLNVLELNLVSLNASYKSSSSTMFINNGRIHQYHSKYFSVEKLIMVMQKLNFIKNFDIYLNLNAQQVKKLRTFNKLQQGINFMSLHLHFDSIAAHFEFLTGKHYKFEMNFLNNQNMLHTQEEIQKNVMEIFLPLDNFMITKVKKLIIQNQNIITGDNQAILVDCIQKCIGQINEISYINLTLNMNSNIDVQVNLIDYLAAQMKKSKFNKIKKLSLEKLSDEVFSNNSMKDICEKLILNKGKLNLLSIEHDFMASLSTKTVDFLIKRHLPQHFTNRIIRSDKITIGQGILECCMMYLSNFQNLERATFAFENMYVDEKVMLNVIQQIVSSIKSCNDFRIFLQNFNLNLSNLHIFEPISRYQNLKNLQIIGNQDKNLEEMNSLVSIERNNFLENEDFDQDAMVLDQKLSLDKLLIYMSEKLKTNNTLQDFTYRPYIQGQKFSNYNMIRSVRNLGFCKSMKFFKIELEDAIKQHIFAEFNNKLTKHQDKKRKICYIIKQIKLKRIEPFHEILQEFY